MYYRFSKLSKTVIIVNIIISIMLCLFCGYLFAKSIESMNLVESFMEEHNVIREDAVMLLTEQGEHLYIGFLVGSYIGFMNNVAAIVTLIWYGRTNSFLIGFISAFVCIFTTFIGGIVLFAVFFSNKREVKGSSEGYEGSTDMSKFIHKRVVN
jgi:hypothetical protein